MPSAFAFVDLAPQRARLGTRIDDAIGRVLDHGRFVAGPEVDRLERELGAFVHAEHVVTCASGTDALVLTLMALGVGRGDRILVPSFTFAATAEAVVLAGAEPIFMDVDLESCNVEVQNLEDAYAACTDHAGPPPVGCIPVDLFGCPVDYQALASAGARKGMWMLVDAAQSFGALRDGRPVGDLARIATTSFYPAKPLGCYGDGGAVLVRGHDLDALLRSIRNHGQDSRYSIHDRIGTTSRLDTIQAAILLEKLSLLNAELAARNRLAKRYTTHLAGRFETPHIPSGTQSTWAQYTIRVDDRDDLIDRLDRAGVPWAIHYERSLPEQTAYKDYRDPTGSPNAKALARRVLSLPIHPYLTENHQDRVIESLCEA